MVLDEDELDGDSETTKMKSDFDDISIDNHDTDAFTISDSKDSKSTSRSLKHSDSELSGWSEVSVYIVTVQGCYSPIIRSQ